MIVTKAAAPSRLGLVGDRPYGIAVRVEPCACGGAISAPADVELAIVAAVRTHNLTERHRSWARLEGFV